MIKLIIFDLDGVLVESKEIHYEALNKALPPEYRISREEHLAKYDGLSTTRKLDKLSAEKGLSESLHSEIWFKKQQTTNEIIDGFVFDERIRATLRRLKKTYLLGCCTNSIRDTAKLQLIRKGFMEFIDFLFTNEDVAAAKPNAEMYLRCMLAAKANPDETLIIEDSHIGRLGAMRSGAHVLAVKNTEDLTQKKIEEYITRIDKKKIFSPKWQGGTTNVLIPMAGHGSRFEKAGYTFPKPLIEVNGKPMIQVVVDNLNIDAQYIFIVQKAHFEKYHLGQMLNLIAPNCKVIQVDGVTEGAACTTLLAKELINNGNPLVIANSDQFVEWNSNEFMYSMSDNIDAGILTFENTHPKWSYAKLDENGFVTEVAEKNPISNVATVGIYYWKSGADYVKYAERMIEKNIRVNNEFYVCPVFNEAIADGKKIKTFKIEKMWGLGTPEDLKYFEEHYGKTH